MQNPWMKIPLAEYEGHMNSPGVEQLGALADLFENALLYSLPDSVGILGIAGGNGLDRVDSAVTTRILGVDIQPAYLEAARERYRNLPLTLICADLRSEILNEEPLRLVHAALIFEHAGLEQCLRNSISLVMCDGYLSVVLQRRSTTEGEISRTQFSAMEALAEHFRLVDQNELCTSLEEMNFTLRHEVGCGLSGGKAFWLGLFKRRECAD